MKRLIIPLTAAAFAAAGTPAFGADQCVGRPHCAPTIQAALDAAHAGDTVRVAPGTYRGGVTIAKDVRLIGDRAVLRGGAPVVTVSAGHVLLQGLTLTKGVVTTGTVCGPNCGTQYQVATALGGGLVVEHGAAVTVRDSAIAGNRADPATTVSSVKAACPGGPCRFASGAGAGIANFGDLTLVGTRVTDNVAGGPLTSDADGGGIYSGDGALTLDHSLVTGNRARAVPPYGRFAEGGGLFVDGGSLTVRHSVVDGNAADLTSSLPAFAGDAFIELGANSGAIHVGDGVPTTITDSRLTANTVTARDPAGEPGAIDAALLVGDGPATIARTLFAGNRLVADDLNTVDTGANGSIVELDGGGTISDSRIVGNSQVQQADGGDASVAGALAIFTFDDDPQLATVSDTVIAGNTARAQTSTGVATAMGAGVFNNSLLTLRRTVVRDNVARAVSAGSVAQGGGVYNGDVFSGPPVALTLDHALITGNRAAGRTGQGGGLFTKFPVTRSASVLAGNAPDDCSGC